MRRVASGGLAVVFAAAGIATVGQGLAGASAPAAINAPATGASLAGAVTPILSLVSSLLGGQTTTTKSTLVPPTIDSTGKADVTSALLLFFSTVPDGSTVLFQPGGKYRVEGSLLLKNRNKLTFDGNGATVFATTPGDRNRRHLWFQGGTGIVVRNLTVKGANPAAGVGDAAYQADKEAQHGFDFEGVKGVELDHVTVTDVYGDFVYLGMYGGAWTDGVHIHDSHFERNGRQGISLTGVRNVVIENNFIAQTRRSTFDLEPNGPTWGIANAVIRNNDVGAGRLFFIASDGNGPIDGVTISGNRLTGRPFTLLVDPPTGTRRSDFHILNNTSDTAYGSPSGGAIIFDSVDGIEVRGNTVPLQQGRNMVGVRTTNSCTITLSNNVFANAVAALAVASPGPCA